MVRALALHLRSQVQISVEDFPNATRTQSSCEKNKSRRSAESRGFSLGIPASSHRES